ncbi:solute carrier family 41 member 1-like [Branchiostoma floridae]|uniref:Solute carrier family 41 member 1-like n=1 Tax=Branchiostoma floridae TaxID=7739 RepID=A0A9J7L7X8_BRAFL|nr:solute carrier family 41 member 1-like [Branchiostoma floridae]
MQLGLEIGESPELAGDIGRRLTFNPTEHVVQRAFGSVCSQMMPADKAGIRQRRQQQQQQSKQQEPQGKQASKMVPKITTDSDTEAGIDPPDLLTSDPDHVKSTHRVRKTSENGPVPSEDLSVEVVDSQPLIREREAREEQKRGEMKHKEETALTIALECFFPYLVAGFGMVAAGMVLDIVQHWPVFIQVSEVFILVPALLGLKGNLEMTLASRLSTAANLGYMDNRKEQWRLILGNMALTQAQALVVGFLAAVAAIVFGWIPEGKFDIHHAFLLTASSMVTASLACAILGTVMIAVVILSRKCKVNPDNVATPIAASLGDLTTLALLSWISNVLWRAITVEDGARFWMAPTITVAFFLSAPFWMYISHKNPHTREVLRHGWEPVICAMVISSGGGLILDFAVSAYHGIAVFTPIINGVGGNLVAVQASRLSTWLHTRGKPGKLPEGAIHGCPNPVRTFFSSGVHSRTARVLFLLVVPGHLIFLYLIAYANAGHTTITAIFTVVYLIAAMIQVAILLFVANWLVHYMWLKGNDPDNCTIPYLTALGDLLGTGLLAVAFHTLWLIGDRDSDVGD